MAKNAVARIEIYHVGLTMVIARAKPGIHAINTARNQEKLVEMFQKIK